MYPPSFDIPVLRCLVFILTMFSLNGTTTAEFVLDDFDKPVSATQDVGSNEVIQFDVGWHSARRRTFVQDLRETPGVQATLDANVSFPSVLTAELSDVPPVIAFPEFTGFSVGYTYPETDGEFGFVDFTENGTNNAFLIDFAFVQGSTPPRTMRLVAYTAAGISVGYISDLVSIDDAFTAVVPFNGFTDRGGRPIPPEFSSLWSFQLEIFSSGLFEFTVDDGWVIGIDRIRVGSAVPEPNGLATTLLFAAGIAAWSHQSFRRSYSPRPREEFLNTPPASGL